MLNGIDITSQTYTLYTNGLQVGVVNDVVLLLEGKHANSQVLKYIAATVKKRPIDVSESL